MRQRIEEEVIRNSEATILFKEGKITEEELKHIRKVNARMRSRKYEQSEKGKETRKKQRERKEYKEKMRIYTHNYYMRNREEIIEKKKEYQKKKREELKTM